MADELHPDRSPDAYTEDPKDNAVVSDSDSSIESVQDGVKQIEGISKAWTMSALVVAYARYVLCI